MARTEWGTQEGKLGGEGAVLVLGVTDLNHQTDIECEGKEHRLRDDTRIIP